MTVAEIIEKFKELSLEEREAVAQTINDLMVGVSPKTDETNEHWGKSLNQLLDEIGPIEMKYPEIEDPVEWVKHLRTESRRRRLGDWGEET